MSLKNIFKHLWDRRPFFNELIEEAELENAMRDNEVAMTRINSSADGVAVSQSRLRESIQSAHSTQLRETYKTLLERTKWPS